MRAKLNSIYLAVKNMKRAVAFYEKLLDQKVSSFDNRMSIFNLGEISFLLYNPQHDKEKISYGNNCIVNFEVDDIEKAIKFTQQQHCDEVMKLEKINGYYIFQVKDPEGNMIEFYQKEN